MELDSDHVNGRCAAVTRVVEEIAAHGDSCAVGVLLLRAMIYTDLGVRDVAFAVMWNVLAVDENNSVGTFADSGRCLDQDLQVLLCRICPTVPCTWGSLGGAAFP